MDERVLRLKSADECAEFARNASQRGRPDLVIEARKRAVELRAKQYGALTQVEAECLEAVFAYEEVLSAKNGRRTTAARTWQMIKRHGVLGAVERAVDRPTETVGYTALVEMGLEDYAFEAVILRHADVFSPNVVQRSKARAEEWKRRTG